MLGWDGMYVATAKDRDAARGEVARVLLALLDGVLERPAG